MKIKHIFFMYLLQFLVNTMEFCNIGLKWKRNIPEIIHNVNFLYHQGPTVNDYIRFPYSRGIEIADQRYFNVFFETVFYFPGWQEDPSANTESVDTICSAFLSNGNVNFVAIDYSQLVKGNDLESYISAVLNATDVGQVVGNFLHLFIPEKQSINYVHLIGFGLGAQIMSHAASEFGSGKLKWLTGLDPAGAIFNLPMIKHLKKEDAEFVDVIHTDANFFGDGRSIGHVDFFPNEGTRFQPFCRRYLDDDFCSHNMAWRYYAESIKNMNYFPARAFKFYWYLYMTMKFPWCDEENTENINMGYGVNKKARGNYLLKTSDFPPYNLGFRGTVIDEVNEDWCGQRNKQVKDTLSEL